MKGQRSYLLDAAAETKTGSTGLHFRSKTLHRTSIVRARTKEKKIAETYVLSAYLGNTSLVLRSQTTRFASTFHALIPPSAVPIRSF